MSLVDGVHHITFLTEDMDRLLAFYVRVFDAEVTLDMTEEGLRHAFLKKVMLPRPGFTDADMLERVDWTTVTLDGV